MPSLNLGPADYERALEALGLSGVRVFHRRTTGSTNDDARQIVSSRLPIVDGAVAIVVAETQTSGRGRGTNTWASPPGSVSLTITAPGVEARRLGVLPLGAGACVAEAIRSLGAPAVVKWPNDILIGDKKVGGILIESQLQGISVSTSTIGVGINVNQEKFSSPNAASLYNFDGTMLDLNELFQAILECIEHAYLELRAGKSSALKDRYLGLLYKFKEPHGFESSGVQFMGSIHDVDENGRLCVESQGTVRTFAFKEVKFLS